MYHTQSYIFFFRRPFETVPTGVGQPLVSTEFSTMRVVALVTFAARILASVWETPLLVLRDGSLLSAIAVTDLKVCTRALRQLIALFRAAPPVVAVRSDQPDYETTQTLLELLSRVGDSENKK